MTTTRTVTYGPGKVATAHFANGKPNIDIDCEARCDCPEHDYERERPKPAGTYVEVRLDNEDANVGPGRVVLLTEREYDDLRAEAAVQALREAADAQDADPEFRDPLRLKSDWLRTRAERIEARDE